MWLASSLASLTTSFDLAQTFKERQPFMARNAAANEVRPGKQEQSVPLARDADAAVREEYEAARRQGRAQALQLFIARHPDHSLAAEARADLERLAK